MSAEAIAWPDHRHSCRCKACKTARHAYVVSGHDGHHPECECDGCRYWNLHGEE